MTMRVSTSFLAVLTFSLGVAAPHAQAARPADKNTQLPFNPLAQAQEGDWLLLHEVVKETERSEGDVVIEVAKVDGDLVKVVARKVGSPSDTLSADTFSRKE